MIQGTVNYYNPVSQEAGVLVPGRGEIVAFNILPPGVRPQTYLVNVYLESYEADTVMPAEIFNGGDTVVIFNEGGDSWKLLGKVVGTPGTPDLVPGRPGPGAIDILNTVVTTNDAGFVSLLEFAERAFISEIKVVPPNNNAYTVKIYSGENKLQASWGDGSVALSGTLTDAAGFGFKSVNRRAVLKLLPAGTYTISLSGERFA